MSVDPLKAIRNILLLMVALILTACMAPAMKPSETHITETPPAEGSIPPLVQATAMLPRPKPTVQAETYSVVVDRVDVHELLFALARDAKVNVDIHSGLTGKVTLNAIDQTLPQLLDRISRQIDMRWESVGPNVVVMPDKPFLRAYKIDYLNMERNVETSVVANSDVGGSSGGASSAGGGASGGSTKIKITQVNAFWKTLVLNIDDLMREEERLVPQSVVSRAAESSSNTRVVAEGAGAARGTTGGLIAGTGAAGSGNQLVQGQAAGSAGSQTTVSGVQVVKYVIANPEAGVLMIRATARIHEKVQQYLDQLLSRIKRQVLIEITIVEVQLNNQYQRGIDWSLLSRGPSGLNISQSALGTNPSGVNSSLFVGSIVQPNLNIGNLLATIKLLDSFGNVRVISSPKLSVLNNQTAILKVADNRVYFSITGSITPGTAISPPISTFTTTPITVAVGLVMNVTPQISETDSVLLNVRPSVTRILDYVNDPNPQLPPGIVNRVPEIQTREMESMIMVNSGQIAVMGGLIQDSITDVQDSIPGLSTIPFFSNRNRANTKTELVVFIRPVVVHDASVDGGDYRAYRSYLPDESFIGRPNPGTPAGRGVN